MTTFMPTPAAFAPVNRPNRSPIVQQPARKCVTPTQYTVAQTEDDRQFEARLQRFLELARVA